MSILTHTLINYQKLSKKKNIYVFTDLKKTFMDSQKIVAFIPKFIQEVVDFESSVNDIYLRLKDIYL
jgi:hypothetical protein